MIKNTDIIKKPPFFSKGCLIFKDSKHTLVKDREKYRCGEKVKNNCHRKDEQNLNAKNLEERFAGLLPKFYLPEGEAVRIFDHFIDVYVKSLRAAGRRDMWLLDIVESTGNLIITDLKAGKEMQKADFLEFKRSYFELVKNFYSDILIGDAMDFLFTLTESRMEKNDMNSFLKKLLNTEQKENAHAFAMHVRHVWLSRDGHIENIEFEPFAWFIFKYFSNMVRIYRPDVPAGFITNTKEFASYDYQEVLQEISDNDMKETYSYNSFATLYAKEKIIKKIFDGFEDLPAQGKIDYLIKLFSPTREMIFAHLRAVMRG